MSRYWNGASGLDQIIVLGVGNLSGQDGGPISISAICRVTSARFGGIIQGRSGGSVVFSLHYDSDLKFYTDGDFSGGPSYVAGDWVYIGYSKAAGSATVRWHFRNISAGGAWAHSNGSTIGDGAGAVDEIWLGKAFGRHDGEMAVAMVTAANLNDAAHEAIGITSLASWLSSGPDTLWPLNQAASTDPVQDIIGAADESSITGTSPAVDADEPPGWSYNLVSGLQLDGQPGVANPAGTPANLTTGQAIATQAGTAAVAGTPTALLFGTQLTGQPALIDPAGAPATVTLGQHIDATPGILAAAGTPGILTFSHVLTAAHGIATPYGAPANLAFAQGFDALPANLAPAGLPANLVANNGFQGLAAAVTPGGLPANLVGADPYQAIAVRTKRLRIRSTTAEVTVR